ncbi:MAG: branched-chain amino acid ABC transporter permease [Proteobacteria bacterium]|nr:branched-chain amino acid ABC transporter permease [Pseudomonadota bacterium]
MLIAQSLNLIFGVMRVVNLAHGSFIVMAGLFTFWFSTRTGLSPLIVLPIVFIVSFVVGGLLQPVLIEPLMNQGRRAELLSLMVTFGLDYVLVQIALHVWGADYVSLPYLQSTWTVGAITLSKAQVVVGLFAMGIVALLYLGLNYTSFGKSLLAASQSPVGAACCGINVRRIRLFAFALGVALASSAGTLLIMILPMAAESADNLTILAFVIVALGGLGEYAGVTIAALLLGLAQSMAGYFFGGDVANVLPFVILIVVMLLWPQGLRRAA